MFIRFLLGNNKISVIFHSILSNVYVLLALIYNSKYLKFYIFNIHILTSPRDLIEL